MDTLAVSSREATERNHRRDFFARQTLWRGLRHFVPLWFSWLLEGLLVCGVGWVVASLLQAPRFAAGLSLLLKVE